MRQANPHGAHKRVRYCVFLLAIGSTARRYHLSLACQPFASTAQGLVDHLIHVEVLVRATPPDEVQPRLATGQFFIPFIDRLITAIGRLYWVIAFQIILPVITRLLA